MTISPNAARATPIPETEPSRLLDVENLGVQFHTAKGWTPAVDGISFDVQPHETLGLVGESGCGKTISMLSILGLAKRSNARTSGTAVFEGQDLLAMSDKSLRDIRGNRIGMIFQQPSRSLNPAFTVGEQIAETIRHHRKTSRKEAWRRAVELLDHLSIPNAEKRAHEYPHTFSGGMCQRVMIAIALSCDPVLLIADEPTTALDVTVQSSILELLRNIQKETGIAIILISHDLGIVSEMCDRTVVMYAGQLVESGPTPSLLAQPRHPYTSGLLRGLPENAINGRLQSIPGSVPPLGEFPAGCRFQPRCEHAVSGLCDHEIEAEIAPDGRLVRCVRSHELSLTGVVRR